MARSTLPWQFTPSTTILSARQRTARELRDRMQLTMRVKDEINRSASKTRRSELTAGENGRPITPAKKQLMPSAATLSRRDPRRPRPGSASRKNATARMRACPTALSEPYRANSHRSNASPPSRGFAGEVVTQDRNVPWHFALHLELDKKNEPDWNPHAHIIFRDRDIETGKRYLYTSAGPKERGAA